MSLLVDYNGSAKVISDFSFEWDLLLGTRAPSPVMSAKRERVAAPGLFQNWSA
jgi:hypothetical protein